MHFDEVLSGKGFVPQRPDNNRGVVLIPLQHGICAIRTAVVQQALLPGTLFSSFRYSRIGRFHVFQGLSHRLHRYRIRHIDHTIGTDWDNESSNCIDVVLFHKMNIRNHFSYQWHVLITAELMAIHT